MSRLISHMHNEKSCRWREIDTRMQGLGERGLRVLMRSGNLFIKAVSETSHSWWNNYRIFNRDR